MEFENKKLRDVAEIARQIMMGEKVLHPNQQKLDVHEPEKDELTADDFKKLRAKKEEVKKEEVEQIDELKKSTLGSYIRKAATDAVDRTAQEIETGEMDKLADKRMKGIKTATKKLSKEEVEELDEVKMADLPSRKVQGRAYGAYKPEPHAVDTLAGPKTKELKAIEAEKKKKMSEMISTYKEQGLKGLFETLNQNKVIIEEPTSAEFDAEIKVAQDKSEGKGKKAEVAAAGIEAVKQEGVEVVEYPLDANEINGYSEVTIGESVEQIEELSKNTLGSYIKKANYAGGMADFKHGRIADNRGDSKEKTSLAATAHKREKGISTAVDKLSKEEVEPTQLMSFKARYKK